MKTIIGYGPHVSHHIFPDGRLKPWVVKANRAFEKRMEAGELCRACGQEWGKTRDSKKWPVVTRDAAKPDVCTRCAPDLI